MKNIEEEKLRASYATLLRVSLRPELVCEI